MNENCYLLLDLEFDPPELDDEKIKLKIEERRKFWAKNSNDMTKGPYYKRYLDYVQNGSIASLLATPELRKTQAAAAKKLVYDEIDDILKRRGEVTEDAIAGIAKLVTKKVSATNPTYQVTSELVQKRASKKGVRLTQGKPKINYKEIYDEYYKAAPKGSDGFKAYDVQLKVLGQTSLYSFLGVTTHGGSCSEDPGTLTQLTQKKRLTIHGNDAESSAGEKLCEACLLTFKDRQSKEAYDNYLSWIERKRILDSAKDQAGIDGGKLSEADANDTIRKLTAIFKDEKKARDVLVAYCEETKGVSWEGQSTVISSLLEKRVCRNCGRLNDKSKEICEECGTDLIIKCPKCGTVIESNSKFCGKCSYDAHQIDLALLRYSQAEQAARQLNIKVANELLTEAKKLWENKNKIAIVQKSISETQSLCGTLFDDLNAAVLEKHYFGAKKLYDDLQHKVPAYHDEDLLKSINQAISESDELWKSAAKLASETEILTVCSKADSICRDNPAILELVRKYPPQPPKNLVVTSDNSRKMNILSWESSSSPGNVTYLVVRKKDSVPLSVDDGDHIGNVSMCSINDATIMPGICYYYAVYAMRAGASSTPVTNKSNPAVSLFEIEDVRLSPGDGKIKLSWKKIPDGCTVELTRTSGNQDTKQITSTSSVGLTDSGLVNDTEYTYQIKLTYPVAGGIKTTPGITISGRPISPPPIVEVTSGKHIKENLFRIAYNNPDAVPLAFYYSEEKPNFTSGEVISIDELKSEMNELSVVIEDNQTASFHYAKDNVIYVVVVSIKAGSVSIGKILQLGKGFSISITAVHEVNGKIYIEFIPPKNANGYVVLYRFDKFATDISDVSTKRRYFSKAQYERYGALVLETPEKKDYYFTVYAEFKNGDESDYSDGAEYCFKNSSKSVIYYSMTVSKKLIGGGVLQVEFTSDENLFDLPEIDLYSSFGKVPMFKSSCSFLEKIPAQTVKHSFSVDLSLKGIGKNAYVKPFLHDDSLHSRYELKAKPNTTLKIT